MNKYLLVYRGAVKPQDGKQHMSDWMSWVHGMGDAMLDPGLPVGPAKTLTANGVTDTQSTSPISGISVIQAVDMHAALDLVKSCPHLNIGGSIELSEAMNMNMS